MKKSDQKRVVIYQAKSGAIELRGDLARNNIWATQAQIASVFEAERSVITKHIRNILSDKELDADSVCAKFAHTGTDGKVYQVQFYNLDVILSVGYRTNSRKAIEFRQWATKTLREHITKGYTLNRKRIGANYEAFLRSVEDIQAMLPGHVALNPKTILDLVKEFASTWVSIDAYDKDMLAATGSTKKKVAVTIEDFLAALATFRESLAADEDTITDVFGHEREQGLVAGIIGNVFQSFGGKEVYPTVEEKAAHLLYFVVKNHPYSDGNKRHGAFAFVWFLKRAGIFARAQITPPALTALTLFVAESDPAHKERMVHLVLQLLKK